MKNYRGQIKKCIKAEGHTKQRPNCTLARESYAESEKSGRGYNQNPKGRRATEGNRGLTKLKDRQRVAKNPKPEGSRNNATRRSSEQLPRVFKNGNTKFAGSQAEM